MISRMTSSRPAPAPADVAFPYLSARAHPLAFSSSRRKRLAFSFRFADYSDSIGQQNGDERYCVLSDFLYSATAVIDFSVNVLERATASPTALLPSVPGQCPSPPPNPRFSAAHASCRGYSRNDWYIRLRQVNVV